MDSLHLNKTEYKVHVYQDAFIQAKPICELFVVQEEIISVVQFVQTGFH
jgi:hypothetical protein